MIKELNSLHHKILHNTSFASEVTESEIQALVMAKKIIEQPKTDWIPCEVEQPKEYGNYLYTDKNGEVHEGCYSPPNIGMINCWSTCEAFGFVRLSDDEVIAWQPLPQPYKKEGAE